MRNTLVTYLEVVNNPAKVGLIHDSQGETSVFPCKDLSLQEGPMSYQLVGEVMAHQGFDG